MTLPPRSLGRTDGRLPVRMDTDSFCPPKMRHSGRKICQSVMLLGLAHKLTSNRHRKSWLVHSFVLSNVASFGRSIKSKSFDLADRQRGVSSRSFPQRTQSILIERRISPITVPEGFKSWAGPAKPNDPPDLDYLGMIFLT